MNFGIIFTTLGWVLVTEGICMLLPLVCALVYSESALLVFACCILLCIIAGFALTRIPLKCKSMYAKEGFITVALSWIVISLFGSLPYILSGTITNFFDAFFETASGFTTTGASILKDVEIVPKSVLFWRSFTHWIGGMGVLVFIVAILPLSGGSNLYLLKAESPGPSVSKLVPKVRSSAKILYGIYLMLTLLQIVLLKISGMKWFDTLTLSFGTAGTGGFAILNSGLADYTPVQQNIITVFMLIFGIDFTFHYLLLTKNFKVAAKLEEVQVYLGVVLISALLIAFNCRGLFKTVADALRHSFFQVASVITTTGYSTADFDLWPEFSKTILVLLMFFGACAGSTGGGIKISRVMILLKSIAKEIIVAVHPKRTRKITINSRPIEHETLRSINVFMAAYMAVFVASMLIISLDNLDFTSNFTAVLSCLNNIGPGLSQVGPTRNFSIYSPLSTFVLSADMLIGRLEIFPMLILFSPYTWKK